MRYSTWYTRLQALIKDCKGFWSKTNNCYGSNWVYTIIENWSMHTKSEWCNFSIRTVSCESDLTKTSVQSEESFKRIRREDLKFANDFTRLKIKANQWLAILSFRNLERKSSVESIGRFSFSSLRFFHHVQTRADTYARRPIYSSVCTFICIIG